jgi:hypothetical protein
MGELTSITGFPDRRRSLSESRHHNRPHALSAMTAVTPQQLAMRPGEAPISRELAPAALAQVLVARAQQLHWASGFIAGNTSTGNA